MDLADSQNERMSPKMSLHTQCFYENILNLNRFPQPKGEHATIFMGSGKERFELVNLNIPLM